MARAKVDAYLEACKSYGVTPCSNVVSFFRLESMTSVTVGKWLRGGPVFRDLDLQPFVDVLQEDGPALARLRSLDLSRARTCTCGGLLASQILTLPGCCLERLNLSHQKIGANGAIELAKAVPKCKSLKTLMLNSCRFGAAGGASFAELVEGSEDAHGLVSLEIRNNVIGYSMTKRLEAAVQSKNRMHVTMAGNKVVDEVLNAVSHGIGLMLAIVGSVFLGLAVRGQKRGNVFAVTLYCVSLHVLYAASMLYHSMQGLPPAALRIFHALDHCAIFLLIAGSYCPFLWILFPGDPVAEMLLTILWTAAIAGVLLSTVYDGPGKKVLNLSITLGMGWSCMSIMGQMLERLGPAGARLLAMGGIGYTAGVPFFVRNRRTLGLPDHTVWHFFVLAGSVCHYYAIFWHVLPVGAAASGLVPGPRGFGYVLPLGEAASGPAPAH